MWISWRPGATRRVLDDLRVNPVTGNGDVAFANNGTLVYRPGGAGSASSQVTMQWIDAAGKRSPLLAKAGTYGGARLSPDGQRVALGLTEGGGQDIGIYDPQRDAMTKLTFGGAPVGNPIGVQTGALSFLAVREWAWPGPGPTVRASHNR